MPPTPPAVGTVDPGELFVDLPTKRMWLGVAPSVTADQAVLLADIDAIADSVSQALADANAYTDSQLLLYAKLNDPIFTGNPRGPTPTPGDNDTSLATTAYVQNAISVITSGLINVGTIVMYSGPLVDIGTGVWAKWSLCNGSTHTVHPPAPQPEYTITTPNLIDKFVLCAGGNDYRGPIVPKTVNPATQLLSQPAGGHSHGGNTKSFTLTATHLPAHTHGVGTLTAKANGTTGANAAHNHNLLTVLGGAGAASGVLRTTGGTSPAWSASYIDSEPGHTHTLSNEPVTLTGATASAGNNGGHGHGINAEPAHQHIVTDEDLKNTVPWVALGFVMKVEY